MAVLHAKTLMNVQLGSLTVQKTLHVITMMVLMTVTVMMDGRNQQTVKVFARTLMNVVGMMYSCITVTNLLSAQTTMDHLHVLAIPYLMMSMVTDQSVTKSTNVLMLIQTTVMT
jgi:hypothetical protein